MMNDKTRILLIEHNPDDAELIIHELKTAGFNFVSELVQNEKEYRHAIGIFMPDIILSDYSLPSFDGDEALNIRRETVPDTPFIFVSGSIGEERSIEYIKNGLTDYVLKDKLFTLAVKVKRALKDAQEKAVNTKTAKALLLSESMLARAQQLAHLGSWELNFSDNEFTLSAEACRIFGLLPAENKLAFDSWKQLVHPGDIARVLQEFNTVALTLQEAGYQHRILLKDGSIKHIHAESKFEFDMNGKACGLYGIMQDVSQRKKTELSLAKAYEEKNAILESIDDGFFATDENSIVTYWNKRAEILLHTPKEDVIGKNLHDIFARNASTIFYDNYQIAISKKTTIHFEGFSNLTKKWFAVSAFGSDNGLSVYFKDITGPKNAEDKVRESELRYRLLNEQATDAICITDASLKFIDINPYACEIFGYSKEEALQLSLPDILFAEDLAANPVKTAALELGKTVRNERRLKRKNGTAVDMEVSTRLLEDRRMIMFGHDITERKIAEQQKEFDRVNLDALINNTTDLMWSIDKDYRIITFNQPFYDTIRIVTGKSLVMGDDIFSAALSPRQARHFKTSYDRALLGETFTVIEHFTNPGESWSEISYYPIRKDAEIIGTACHSRDITARKKAGIKLAQSEKQYRQIVETAQEGIWLIDEHNTTTFVNKKMADILGYIPAEMLGKQNYSFMDEEWKKRASDHIESRKLGINENHDFKYITKSGKEIWTNISTNPVFDDGGKYKGALAMVTDISEKIKSGQQLIIQEKYFRTLVENGADAVVILSSEGKPQYVSPTVEKILGYTEDELFKLDMFGLLHPEDIPLVTKVWDKVHASPGVPIPGQPARMLHKNGNWRWMEATITNMLHDPALNGIVDNFRDVTDKKELEDLLHKTNSLARIGSWEVDLIKDTLYWSDITKEIHEVDDDYIPGLQQAINFYKTGESRELISQKLRGAIEKGSPWDVELQILTVNGHEKWVRVIGETECLHEKAIRINGSFQDIDIRKRAELAVKEVLEEKNSILESIDDAFFAVEKNWVVTYWNKQAEKVLGKTKAQMLDHNLWDVFADSVDSESYKNYARAIETNQSVHFEDYYQPLAKWYEISAYPSEHGLSVYFKDVSERKLSDIKLSELNESLHKQAKALTVSNADLEQFAYVASHDLQEPLRMVTSFLTQLQKKYGAIIDDKGKQYIEFAVDGAKRMRQIILDLLEFSRVGRTEDEQEDIDLDEIVAEIKVLFRKQVQEKNAVIRSQHLPHVPGYKSPIRQVFQNLVSNALKYTLQDRPVEISISVEDFGDHWQFAIHDNGIGIDAEYFDRIFIIFQRLHNKDEFSGTGMGLAITKKIIENQGGRIWVTSVVDKGSTFYFTLLKTMLN